MKFLGKRSLGLGEHQESPGMCAHSPYSQFSAYEIDFVGRGGQRTQQPQLLKQFSADSDARPAEVPVIS